MSHAAMNNNRSSSSSAGTRPTLDRRNRHDNNNTTKAHNNAEGGGGGVTKLQLTLHATKLRNVAGAFKGTSDPFAVVTILASTDYCGALKEGEEGGRGGDNKPFVLGKTEVIKNNLSPTWTKAFYINYTFGQPLYINVGIWDEVRKSKHDKPMGSVVFEIGDILGNRNCIKAKSLKNDGGTIYATIEPAPTIPSGELQLWLRGVNLKNVEGEGFRGSVMGGKSDPFFELARQLRQRRPGSIGGGVNTTTNAMWRTVVRSKHVTNNLNPKWPSITVSLDRLCNGDYNRPILVMVLDWEKSGKHRPMGMFETTLNELISSKTNGGNGSGVGSGQRGKKFNLVNRKGKSYGSVVVTEAVVTGGGRRRDEAPSSVGPPSTLSSANDGGASSSTYNNDSHGVTAAATAAAASPSTTTQGQSAETTEGLPKPPVVPVPVVVLPAPNSTASTTPPQPAARLPTPTPTPIQTPPLPKPTFVDYITSGCELQMCVGIDFTGSNGDPRIPGTLHYRYHNKTSYNDYEKAISAVGSILAKFDSDQNFPVWGFGAKIDGVIQHCFQVGSQPEQNGIDGILKAYHSVFKRPITMSGPTVLAEVIDLASKQAINRQNEASKVGKQSYTILLILTDGIVSDVNRTREAIRKASLTPLSIVIVGIGSANFDDMRFLDNCGSSCSSSDDEEDVEKGREKKKKERDIVQFVEFDSHRHSKSSLTRCTLEEIPYQLVEYFYGNGIMPLTKQKPGPGQTRDGSRDRGIMDDGGLGSSSDDDDDVVIPDEYDEDFDIDLSLHFTTDGDVQLKNNIDDDENSSTTTNNSNDNDNNEKDNDDNKKTHSRGLFVDNSYHYSSNKNGVRRPATNTTTTTKKYTIGGGRVSVIGPQYSVLSNNNSVQVQVPDGVSPGMPIQVYNPNTGEIMVVIVPPDTPPGGILSIGL